MNFTGALHVEDCWFANPKALILTTFPFPWTIVTIHIKKKSIMNGQYVEKI